MTYSVAELVALMRERAPGLGLSDYQRRVLAHIREQACTDEICPRCERAAIIEFDAKVDRATAEELAAGEAEKWWGPWEAFQRAYVRHGVPYLEALRMLEGNKDK